MGLPLSTTNEEAEDAWAGARAEARTELVFAVLAVLTLLWFAGSCNLALDWVKRGGIPDFRGIAGPMFLKFAWLQLLSLVTGVPFLHRRRWAWSACTGFLFAASAGSTVWPLMDSLVLHWNTVRGGLLGDPLAWNAGLLWVLLAMSFGARASFSVRPREGWRVLLREGGWAIGATAVVEAAALLWLWSSPHPPE